MERPEGAAGGGFGIGFETGDLGLDRQDLRVEAPLHVRLDAEARENLFTPFYTNKSRGTGLGLSIVKRILDAHGGSVTVKGRHGIGVALIMRLPCQS